MVTAWRCSRYLACDDHVVRHEDARRRELWREVGNGSWYGNVALCILRRDVAHGNRHGRARDLCRGEGHVIQHGYATRGKLLRDVAMVAGM